MSHDHKKTCGWTSVGSGYSKALKTKLVYATVPHNNSEEKGACWDSIHIVMKVSSKSSLCGIWGESVK